MSETQIIIDTHNNKYNYVHSYNMYNDNNLVNCH